MGVDLQKRTITLPEAKNGEKRIVPLSTVAVSILKGLAKVKRIDGKVWGMSEDSITRVFDRACKRARTKIEAEAKKEKGNRIRSLKISVSTTSGTKRPADFLRRA